METKNVLVALDVGTTKVCTVIASEGSDGFQILGVGSHSSHGLKKAPSLTSKKQFNQ